MYLNFEYISILPKIASKNLHKKRNFARKKWLKSPNMALFGLIIINKNYFDKNYFIIFTFLAIYDNLEAVLKPKIEER